MMKIDLFPDQIGLTLPDGQRLTTALGGHLGNSSYGRSVTPTSDALRSSASYVAGLCRDGIAFGGLQDRFAANHLSKITGAGGATLRGAIATRNKANADFDAILKRDVNDIRALRIEARLAGMKAGDIVNAMHRDAEVAHVALADPEMFNLAPAAVDGLRRSVAMANLVRDGLAGMVRKASWNDALAQEPNRRDAEYAAKATLTAIDAMKAEAQAGAEWLRGVANYGATLSGRPQHVVFDMIADAA